MRYITRLENYGTYAWWVRIQTVKMKKNVEILQKSFAYRDYCGKDGALEAAIKWRDEQLLLHPERGPGYKDKNLKEYGNPRKNNNTGIDGVTIIYIAARQSISVKARYYNDAGQIRTKNFTIGRKYNIDEAFYMAAKARYKLTGREEEFDNVTLDFERIRTIYKELCILHGMEQK